MRADALFTKTLIPGVGFPGGGCGGGEGDAGGGDAGVEPAEGVGRVER